MGAFGTRSQPGRPRAVEQEAGWSRKHGRQISEMTRKIRASTARSTSTRWECLVHRESVGHRAGGRAGQTEVAMAKHYGR
eukprot:4441938-Pyramimonas_sp.AAC.1